MESLTALTLAQQQKNRTRFLLIGALFVSGIVPIFVAGLLGRNVAAISFSTFVLGGFIGCLGLTSTLNSDADWVKDFRTSAREALFIGIPILLVLNLFLLGIIVSVARNTDGVGKYLVVEHGGRLEVMTNGRRFNFTDRVVSTIPGALSLWNLHSVTDGKSFQVVVETEPRFGRDINIPVLVFPTDEQKLLLLYQRTLGQPLKEVMAGQVGGLVVRYLESLPAEDRLGVNKLTLVWDVPVNSVFHGIGARLEGSNQLRLLVQVLPKPVEVQTPVPIHGQNPGTTERIVPVSSLST